MNGIKRLQFYTHAEDVGYDAVLTTQKGDWYVKLDGDIIGPYPVAIETSPVPDEMQEGEEK